MNEKMNLDKIIWLDTNAIFLYPILKEYTQTQKELGMNYLSLGSLRYDEKYFVGFVHTDDSNFPIELVSYIQYKMMPNLLVLNYMEVAEKYRGNGLAKVTIDTFADQAGIDINCPAVVTTFSSDGLRANLMDKLKEKLTGDIVETSKRNIR
ncbi:MAG: hypothetical protein RRY16_01640 [Bacilli bacterium]